MKDSKYQELLQEFSQLKEQSILQQEELKVHFPHLLTFL